jgi:hypothetical protein
MMSEYMASKKAGVVNTLDNAGRVLHDLPA